jgi:hypothetical protein
MSTSPFLHVFEDAAPDRQALIAQSPSMQLLLQRLPRLAEAGGAVLLRGERGTLILRETRLCLCPGDLGVRAGLGRFGGGSENGHPACRILPRIS